MKVYKALIVFCVAGALTSPLQATAGETTMKLSLSDAISMARQNNSSIKASRSRIDQAEARGCSDPSVIAAESHTVGDSYGD